MIVYLLRILASVTQLFVIESSTVTCNLCIYITVTPKCILQRHFMIPYLITKHRIIIRVIKEPFTRANFQYG